MKGCLVIVTTVLLIRLTRVESSHHIDGAVFTNVLQKLARDTLGAEEIQVNSQTHTHTHTHTLENTDLNPKVDFGF